MHNGLTMLSTNQHQRQQKPLGSSDTFVLQRLQHIHLSWTPMVQLLCSLVQTMIQLIKHALPMPQAINHLRFDWTTIPSKISVWYCLEQDRINTLLFQLLSLCCRLSIKWISTIRSTSTNAWNTIDSRNIKFSIERNPTYYSQFWCHIRTTSMIITWLSLSRNIYVFFVIV